MTCSNNPFVLWPDNFNCIEMRLSTHSELLLSWLYENSSSIKFNFIFFFFGIFIASLLISTQFFAVLSWWKLNWHHWSTFAWYRYENRLNKNSLLEIKIKWNGEIIRIVYFQFYCLCWWPRSSNNHWLFTQWIVLDICWFSLLVFFMVFC